MATASEISSLRRLIDDEETPYEYEDQYLSDLIDEMGGDLNLAAAEVWQSRAAKYSRLVDVAESGSTRKMSDLYKNALAVARSFRSAAAEASGDLSSRPRTRSIERL